MRNSGIHVNMKTVRLIMRNHNLALPYGKHKNRTGKRDLTKPANINMLWETDIHYVSTSRDGMAYLMSIKDWATITQLSSGACSWTLQGLPSYDPWLSSHDTAMTPERLHFCGNLRNAVWPSQHTTCSALPYTA